MIVVVGRHLLDGNDRRGAGAMFCRRRFSIEHGVQEEDEVFQGAAPTFGCGVASWGDTIGQPAYGIADGFIGAIGEEDRAAGGGEGRHKEVPRGEARRIAWHRPEHHDHSNRPECQGSPHPGPEVEPRFHLYPILEIPGEKEEERRDEGPEELVTAPGRDPLVCFSQHGEEGGPIERHGRDEDGQAAHERGNAQHFFLFHGLSPVMPGVGVSG